MTDEPGEHPAPPGDLGARSPSLVSLARLFSGSHLIAQKWSAALRDHPTKPAGLLYPARHDPARNACALFDLPGSALEVTNAGSLLNSKHAAQLGEILDRYDFGLIDSQAPAERTGV